MAVLIPQAYLPGFIARIAAGVMMAVILAACEPGSPPADTLLVNGNIYTVDDQSPWAQAIAIRNGHIEAIGVDSGLDELAGPETAVVNLGGRLVLPAFGDAHVHPILGGISFAQCSMHSDTSVEGYLATVAKCLEDTPGDGVLYGRGWGPGLFPPEGIPHKSLLDEVAPDRPVIFSSTGGHSYWLNSAALEMAGIDRHTPDPPNGRIDRDPETGEPIGGLQESAKDLVKDLIPAPTQEQLQGAILYALEHFNSLGITNWHDAGIDLAADDMSDALSAYEVLAKKSELTSHVSLAFTWDNERSLAQVETIVEAANRAAESGLDAMSVKFYIDGVIPQRTAAMLEPYENSDETRGELQVSEEVLKQAVTTLGGAGIQSHVHAIGDRATRVGLDAFEAARKTNGSIERPMISHLSVIDPDDQPRFGELGAIAVFQPTWSSNYPYMDITKDMIGAERSGNIYPAKGVLDGGGMIAYGADWPVATADPLLGLQVAVTRVNYEVPDSEPLLPGQVLSLEEAVRAHTINVAVALGNDKVTGSLKTGKSADLIVLDKNIFDLPDMEVGSANVLLTLFEGEAVFGSLDQLAAD